MTSARRALTALALLAVLAIASCGVRSRPVWPGGVWQQDKPAPAGSPAAP